MAVVTFTGDFCSGGNHVDLDVSVNGTHAMTVRSREVSEFLEPLTDEDRWGFVKTALKLKKIGLTNAQLKAALIAGIAVTV